MLPYLSRESSKTRRQIRSSGDEVLDEGEGSLLLLDQSHDVPTSECSDPIAAAANEPVDPVEGEEAAVLRRTRALVHSPDSADAIRVKGKQRDNEWKPKMNLRSKVKQFEDWERSWVMDNLWIHFLIPSINMVDFFCSGQSILGELCCPCLSCCAFQFWVGLKGPFL